MSLDVCGERAAKMRLLSGKSSEKLGSLQTNSMYIDGCCVIFYISKLTKTSRPNFHQKLLEFLAYPSDNLLCIIRMLKLYLDKTEVKR